jgi:hypothetical protein
LHDSVILAELLSFSGTLQWPLRDVLKANGLNVDWNTFGLTENTCDFSAVIHQIGRPAMFVSRTYIIFLDFKLSPCSECCLLSSG